MSWRPPCQRGYALWVILLSLGVSGAGGYWLLGGTAGQLIESSEALSRQQLLQARRALLVYASGYADSYRDTGAGIGHLPCPDLSPINDGIDTNDGPDPPCRNRWLGRMPRYTFSDDGNSRKLIEFSPPASLLDQQMWYAVSPTHVNNPASPPVNTHTRGLLRVDGVDDIVAVLVAPGTALQEAAQQRPSNQPEDYLESLADPASPVFRTLAGAAGNDRLVYITRGALMGAASRRVGLYLRRLLSRFMHMHCGGESVGSCVPDNDLFYCRNETVDNDETVVTGPAKQPADAPSGSCWLAQALFDERRYTEPTTRTDEIQRRVNRHWLFRNDWLAVYGYQRDDRCRGRAAARCVVVFEPSSNDSRELAGVIHVHPAETGEQAGRTGS